MIDRLELQSGTARRFLLDMPMMTAAGEIVAAYDVLRRYKAFVEQADKTRLDTLRFRLQGLKDIRTTLRNLTRGAVLDDIELFEVKHLSLLAADVARLLRQHGMDDVAQIPDLDEVISILDPDGMKIATFYIYDSYCAQLKDLRGQMRRHPEQQEELMMMASALEDGVRMDLSQRLHPFAAAIEQAQTALALTDINVAKASQMIHLGLCFPALSHDGTTHYEHMFHPQVKDTLAAAGKSFQPVTVGYGARPALITGANMGGKTVVLKTLTMCQYLFQFAFGIPAASAVIAVKDSVIFCIGDDQSIEKGLSSFAAEMQRIDAVVKASRDDKKLLALIDEPARTTNPAEGAALVTALLKVLSAARDASLVMTTHYDIEPGDALCLRVKGFENGAMDYSLVEVQDGEVPHEALNIAESLGIDGEWINEARRLLASRENTKQNNNL